MNKIIKTPTKKDAVIYTRVSSERQVENTSLGEQERVCIDFCSSHSRQLNINKVFTEKGESAKTTERTELKAMLAYCSKHRNEIGYVVVYKIDRLSRKMADFLMLKTTLAKMGIEVHSATEPIGGGSNTDVLMENILASFAQFDNDVRGERAKGGMHAAAKEGGWVGPAPTGYVNSRTELKQPTLAIIESQYKPLTKFFNAFATGKYTQEEAVELANRCGVRSNTGQPLARNSVFKLLRKIAYAGYIKSKATNYIAVKGLHEGYITLDTFDRIQAILDTKSRPVDNSKIKKKIYPLKSFLLCGICGKPLTASAPRGKLSKAGDIKKNTYESYHCHRCTIKKNNARVSISKDEAHERFKAQLERAEPAPWVPKLFREVLVSRLGADFKEAIAQRREIDKKISQIEDEKISLVRKFAQSMISDDAYKATEQYIDKEKSRLVMQREALSSIEDMKEAAVDNAVHFIINMASTWNDLPFEHKQKFQSALLLEPIVVSSNGNFGTPHFSPIIQESTDIESYVSKNKIDPSAEKSILAAKMIF